VDIRPEQPSDEVSVRRLHHAAFGDHGAVVAPLVDALRTTLRPEQDLSLVATDEQGLLGHVMFTRSLLDAPRRLVDVSVLSPLAVLPGRQGAGIGSALVRRGLDLMAARRVPVVFLEGAPAYYSRFGFRPGAELGFRRPSLRIPDAAFQAVPLPAHEAWMTGTLVYSQVFWDHDSVGLRDAG
jgi:putative acetyltransferase